MDFDHNLNKNYQKADHYFKVKSECRIKIYTSIRE